MRELVRSNNAVMLSYLQSVLRDSGIDAVLLDQNMSIMEGSLGVLPRRLMVPDERFEAARQLALDCGIEPYED